MARSAERKKLAYLVTVPTALDVGSHTEAGRASGGKSPCAVPIFESSKLESVRSDATKAPNVQLNTVQQK